jgi:CHAT domain-containing protein
LPQARYAHLATHGFFADPTVPSVLHLDPQLFTSSGRDRAAPGSRNPLVLSGLVLAGANQPAASFDPLSHDDLGILTAEAIAGLPLQGLELVVLSACETGLGRVAGGEGVFGLQRAFHLAGAETVVASLWKVSDEATRRLMAEFYRNLGVKKLPRLEALRQAQLTLLRDYRPGAQGGRGGLVKEVDRRVEELPEKEPVEGSGDPRRTLAIGCRRSTGRPSCSRATGDERAMGRGRSRR